MVQRSDGTWRYAILDGRDGDKMEFQVDSGENDYKLFCPEEFHKIRRLDCGGGGKWVAFVCAAAGVRGLQFPIILLANDCSLSVSTCGLASGM